HSGASGPPGARHACARHSTGPVPDATSGSASISDRTDRTATLFAASSAATTAARISHFAAHVGASKAGTLTSSLVGLAASAKLFAVYNTDYGEHDQSQQHGYNHQPDPRIASEEGFIRKCH